ncbi:MAG: glutamate synthase-related protein, partial [Methanosarcinales archaeon]
MKFNLMPPEFIVNIDYESCRKCKRCLINCSFGALTFKNKIVPDNNKCVACQRCVSFCPEAAITVRENPLAFRYNANWNPSIRKNIWKQAETGGILLTGMGNPNPYPIIWDHLVIDACQVTNPSIDPLREPMELRTYLGSKPDYLEFEDGKLKTEFGPQIKLEIPIVFAAMSYGAVSYNVHKS